MKNRIVFIITLMGCIAAQAWPQSPFLVKDHYTKQEHMIPMRDGVKLYTAVYVPKDTSRKYPVMFMRTPYSVGPYGPDRYRATLGPSVHFDRDGFIFVHQDIRGKFMSEGEYVYMKPYLPVKKNKQDVDHSSDTYDTVEWLLKNVRHHNGRVGIWGISYPGFLAAMAAIDAHPSVKAVSPQAPMGDTFLGDDFHHNGAFFLTHAFRWLAGTAPGQSNREAAGGTRRRRGFDYGTPDGYRFFLELGALGNADARYFKGTVPVWNEFMQHGTYDQYWKAQNVPQHMKSVRPAIMIVAGWFDSEDPWGAVNIYNAIMEKSPQTSNRIVWGPWHHGGWARVDGDTLGEIRFGVKTSLWYRENVELPFFQYYLKDKGDGNLPNVSAFMTGENEWRSFSSWPPAEASTQDLYLHPNGKLSFERPAGSVPAYDEYVSDPAKPVPFTQEITTSMGHVFMVEDQRFASTRPDVLVYETEVLEEDVTIAGPVFPRLFVSTSGTDCDWIVKLIDVFPGDTADPLPNPRNVRMGHFQMLVGSEVVRSKFRNSMERPEPMKPGEVTEIEFRIPDKLHRFKKGHRIMVHIQSTRFPLIDRNPGTFVDIYNAKDADFQKTTQRVYRQGPSSSALRLSIIK